MTSTAANALPDESGAVERGADDAAVDSARIEVDARKRDYARAQQEGPQSMIDDGASEEQVNRYYAPQEESAFEPITMHGSAGEELFYARNPELEGAPGFEPVR